MVVIYMCIGIGSKMAPMLHNANIEVVQTWRAWYFGGREFAWVYLRLRKGKRAKVASNLLYVFSYRGSNIIHTKS